MKKVAIHLSSWPLFITILLCVLKCIGIISISWWWCFCAYWLPIVIVLLSVLLIFITTVIFLLIASIIEILNNR